MITNARFSMKELDLFIALKWLLTNKGWSSVWEMWQSRKENKEMFWIEIGLCLL